VGKAVEKLASFAIRTKFGDLPDNVVHEMKRVLLDSIGCAIVGLSTERGKIAADLSRKLGGPRESTIIGINDKVSCANAAFANGELINALDFDALSVAVHDVPCLIAAILAVAERCHTSGRDLMLAIALSFEISARFKSAVAQPPPIGEGSERGTLQWPAVMGFGSAALAAAAGAGKILNLDLEKMANAIGIAGYICPPSISRKWFDTAPVTMIKYGSAGWAAQAGVTSALLAEMGFTGDTHLFDGEYGFWRYTGQEQRRTTEEVLADLGTEWYCYQMNYKQYPSGY
jgi:2-methylcitrate dehydratase PrpD